MKRGLLILIILVINCCGMEYLSEEQLEAKYHQEIYKLSEYQKNRDRMLLESLTVCSFKRLNKLTEEEKDQWFIECLNKQGYISYERMQCLKTGGANILSWLGIGLVSYIFCIKKGDVWENEQSTAESKKMATAVVCVVCGAALFCGALISSCLLCDACKGLRWGKRCQKEYEQVLQLKTIGAKKGD